jgi:hypothetical protein
MGTLYYPAVHAAASLPAGLTLAVGWDLRNLKTHLKYI